MKQEQRPVSKIWIIHFGTLFLFLGSCGIFYMLGGGTGEEPLESENKKSVDVDVFPEAYSDDLADDRLEAFQRANALLEQESKERHLQEEHNSFHFFMDDVQTESSSIDDESLQSKDRSAEELLAEVKQEVKPAKMSASSSRESARTVRREEQVSESFSEEEYYDRLALEKQREKEEREKRLYELYYGKRQEEKTDEPQETKQPVATTSTEKKRGFRTIGGNASNSSANSIRAVVHGEQRNITSASQVRLRILDPITVDGCKIPANTLIIGKASFNENRVNITIENIAYNNNVYPFRGTIYDQDGFQGIYFPDNLVNDAKKEAGGETVSSANVNLGSLSGIVSSSANALVNATKNVLSGSIKETKITLPADYKLIIKTNE